MTKLIAALIAAMFATGAVYAQDKKADDKKAGSRRRQERREESRSQEVIDTSVDQRQGFSPAFFHGAAAGCAALSGPRRPRA